MSATAEAPSRNGDGPKREAVRYREAVKARMRKYEVGPGGVARRVTPKEPEVDQFLLECQLYELEPLAEQIYADTATPRSMQEPLRTAEGDVIGLFGDLVEDPSAEDAYDDVLDGIEAEELLPLLSVLSDRQRRILEAHYGLDGEPKSHREIAERLGISINRVRQIERRALNKLRRAAQAAGLNR